MRCASGSGSERQVSEQVGERAISMMAKNARFDGERQFVPTAAVVFSSRRAGRRCRRIAAVRCRCRRGVVSTPSDKPHSTLDKATQKHFGSDSPTTKKLVLSRVMSGITLQRYPGRHRGGNGWGKCT